MLHGIKEVPNLYYYVDGGYIGNERSLVSFDYIYDQNDILGSHRIIAKSALLDRYLLQSLQNLSDFTIYTFTYGRQRDTGKDEPIFYKYTGVNLERFEYGMKVDGDPARFEYVFSAGTREPISIDELPQVVRDEIR